MNHSFHTVDAEAHDTGGNMNLDDIARLFVEQGLCDGRFDGDFPFANIGLMGTGYGIGHVAVVGQIGHFHPAEQLHSVG